MNGKNVAVDFILDIDNTGFNQAMSGAQKSVKGFLGTAAGLIGGSAILGGLGKSAITMAADFDQGFSKVSTLFGDVEVDTDNLKGKILDLSTQTGIAATELNEGLYSALSAGIPVSNDMTEAMNFLEQATKLSVAGFTSTEKAVDVATTVLNAYGLEASETESVMNTLIETQNAGKTTVDELASSIGKAIPFASTLGVNFEELSASTAILTANGINTAESTTALSALFKEMSDNGSDVNKIFKEISGTTIDEYIKQGGNLQGVLDELNGHLGDQNLKWGDILSSSESVTAAQTLTKDGGDALSDTYKRMTDETYELNDAYETMQTPLQKLKKFQEAWKSQLIETGDALLEKLEPAIDWAIENIDILVPLVFKLAVGFGVLLVAGAAASAVNSLATAFGGLTGAAKLAGKALLGTEGKAGLLAKALTALGPTGLAVGAVVAGAVAMGIAFGVDFAAIARNAIDGVMTGLTGLTSAQRDFKSDVEDINKKLGDELVRIQESYQTQLENGEITSQEARTKTVEDQVEARISAEEEYNERFAELQNERYAEEQVAAAKASGSKKELLDSSEQELLDLRKQWDAKNDELILANRNEDVEAQEKINQELLDLEEKAGDELLILKAGNRASDEEDFRNYTDSLKADMTDMSKREKQNYEERAKAGEEFRKGTFMAQLYANDKMKASFKTAKNEQVQLERAANGNITTIITDELGNQIEATKTANGEINTIITDANGVEIEGSKRQKSQVEALENEKWANLLTTAGGGSQNMQEAMDNMWNGILSTADTSDKKLQNKAKKSGEILGGIWLDNGMITQEQYDQGISQLDEVTQAAVDKANEIEAVEIKGEITEALEEFNKLPGQTQKTIDEAEALGPINIESKVDEADNTFSIWESARQGILSYGAIQIQTEVTSNSGVGVGNQQGPQPQSAPTPRTRGARGAVSTSVTSGQAGLGQVNRLANVSLNNQVASEPQTEKQTVVYNQIQLTSEIGQVNDVMSVEELGTIVFDMFDDKMGGMLV